jgi:hypothetical protein
LAGRATEEGAAIAATRARAFGVAVVAAGTLLVTWPFVRVPALSIVPAYLHLLGAWVVVIAAIAALSRALARRARDDEDA